MNLIIARLSLRLLNSHLVLLVLFWLFIKTTVWNLFPYPSLKEKNIYHCISSKKCFANLISFTSREISWPMFLSLFLGPLLRNGIALEKFSFEEWWGLVFYPPTQKRWAFSFPFFRVFVCISFFGSNFVSFIRCTELQFCWLTFSHNIKRNSIDLLLQSSHVVKVPYKHFQATYLQVNNRRLDLKTIDFTTVILK